MSRCYCIIVLLTASVCHFPDVNSQEDIGMCQSEYLEQPPDLFTCNPYLNTELKLECTVSLLDAGTLSGRLAVDWFHSTIMLDGSAENPLAINRLDSMQENVTVREQVMIGGSSVRIRSRLELLNLGEMAVGQYWCGIRSDSMEWMVLSDPVLLLHPEEYADLLPCSMTVAQNKRERKCATWNFGPSSPQTTRTLQFTVMPSMSPATALPATEPVSPPAGPTILDETTGSAGEPEGDAPLLEFYIAIGILVAFGSLITALVSLVACMCIKYRKVLRRKRRLDAEEEKAPTVSVQSPSTVATDYLVPLSMVEQRQVLQLPAMSVRDNPVYLSGVRQELTTLWLRQQQQRAEGFEHSYETMTHDYEDIFLESLSGGIANPVLMKANEAYIIPRTLSSSWAQAATVAC